MTRKTLDATFDPPPQDWQQACLEAALEEQFGTGPPPDLARRILQRVATPPRCAAVRAPDAAWPRLASAALVCLGLAAVLAVAALGPDGSAPAQDPAHAGLPLQPGATWVYQVRASEKEEGRTVTWRVMTHVDLKVPGAAAPVRVHQVLVEDAGQLAFVYLAVDSMGVRRFGAAGFAMPGVDPVAPAMLLLPASADSRWQTAGRFWQRLDGDRAGRLLRATNRMDGELLAADAMVKVPAGTFRARHVRLQPRDAEQPDQTVEQLWFAPGTGIVRRVTERDGANTETAELVAFTPGLADPEPDATLARFLQRDAGIANLGPPQGTRWIDLPPEVLQLRTRFAIVRFFDGNKVFAVRAGEVALFDASAADAYAALLRKEGMTGWTQGVLPQARTTALAELACRLHAALRGLADPRRPPVGAWTFSAGPLQASIRLTMIARDGAGEEQRVSVSLVIAHDDTVRELEVH